MKNLTGKLTLPLFDKIITGSYVDYMHCVIIFWMQQHFFKSLAIED